MSNFDKYTKDGAYHLNAVIPVTNRIRKLCPWLLARYELPFVIAKLVHSLDLMKLRGLDVGCGDGAFVALVEKGGGRIIGIDSSTTGITIGKEEIRKRLNKEVDMRCGSAYELPFEDSSFDYVVSLELIEHLDDHNRYIEEIARVVASNGLVIISTPNQINSNYSDKYHIKEYFPQEFLDFLSKNFRDVKLYGFISKRLLNAYSTNLLVRVLLKVLTYFGINPFLKLHSINCADKYMNIMAVCKK